jgi:hypothetical protein
LNRIAYGNDSLHSLKYIAKKLYETKSRCMDAYIVPHITAAEIMEVNPNYEDDDEQRTEQCYAN